MKYDRMLIIAALLIGVVAPALVAAQIRVPRSTPTLSGTTGPAPTGLSATPTSATSISIGWNAMSGAKGYLVERRKTSDASCCNSMSGSLVLPGWTDNGVAASTQYTYRVNVTYTDGSTGYAEVSATTPAPPVTAPLPDSYSSDVTDRIIAIRWSPVLGASEYALLRNGTEIARGGACTPTCVMTASGDYGATYSFAIKVFFAASNVIPSTTPPINVTVPHIITLPAPGYFFIARDGRVDFQITNTANPDNTRSGLVSGSGNGIIVRDPGLNKLAMTTSRDAPLGTQKIQLTAANTKPVSIDAVVIRTPGLGSAVFPGVGAFSPPGTTSTLRVDQLGGPRWAATFNSLPPIEFERDNNFGGAAFCVNSDAVGVVVSSNGKKLGLASPWGVVLQELNRSAPPHVLEARRYSSDGKVGLVPTVLTTPDCTLAVIVDVSDNPAAPYRVRTYDLLTRQMLGTDTFATSTMAYDTVRPALYIGDLDAMKLSVTYPGQARVFVIPNRSF